jgi:hypothetical protein
MTPTALGTRNAPTEVVDIPTPHPAFGHLLPVEGRRSAVRGTDFPKPLPARDASIAQHFDTSVLRRIRI